MTKRLTQEQFIERCINKHGSKYDYSKAVYNGIDNRVIIVCPVHGEFEQTPYLHMKTSGCRKCANETKSKAKEFMQRAREVHGDRYDYSKVNYTLATNPVTIICPIHGEFEQTPAVHINQQSGCYTCARTQTEEEIVQRARSIHGTKYEYSIKSHTKGSDKIDIICPSHGLFNQRLSSHLEGHGCPKCAIDERTLTFKEFVSRANKVHNNKFQYVEKSYTKAHGDIEVICPNHGNYITNASNHLHGSDCPVCSIPGFNKSKPATLYYLSINNGQAYKIGITGNTVEKRFGSDMEYIQILHQVHYKSGEEAFIEEQRILKENKQHQYTGPNLLQSGNTELFNIDIFNKER